MTDDDILLISFYVVLPLVGLVLGAGVPPFLYARCVRLAALLNMAGLVLFVFCAYAPLSFVCLPYWNPDGASPVEVACGIGIALALFAAVEVGVYLLRRYLHHKTV